MKNIKMKKVISLALLGATTSLMAMYGEHASLYKDPRVMGMGGANVAVGGYSTSVFSNPAGLASIKKDSGFVVDLLGMGFTASADFANLVEDLGDASDTGENSDMMNVLQEYAGNNFHFGFDNYSAISKNSSLFAWSVGFLTAADINLVTHANGSITGGFLETSSRVYGGVVLGAAKPYNTDYGRVDVGVSLKVISQQSYEGSLGLSELQGDDVTESLQDKFEKSSSGFGVDIGATYFPLEDNFWNPSVGLSILNIGTMGMDENYGGQPITVNVGMAISPKVPFIEKFILALDYVDLFNANKVRMYEYTDDGGIVNFTDYTESDMTKRLRLGVSVGLLDTWLLSTTLNGGLYQGAYTAGLDVEFLLLKFNFATYQEQIGTGDIDIADRRYMAKIGIGW